MRATLMATSETGTFLRWLVIVVLSAATAAMIGVSMRGNYLFGLSIGQTDERAQVFAWANVAADVWKVSGLILITSVWRSGRKNLAFMLTPLWALCLLWGLVGAVGIYAQDRTTLIGGREAKAASLKDAEHELNEVEAKLARTKELRTPFEIDAAIASMLARPVMAGSRLRGTIGNISADCTKYDRSTADACLDVAKLREERAAAEQVQALEHHRTELRALVGKLRDAGGNVQADPLAGLIVWLSRGRLDVHDIGLGFPLAFAVLIELVSAFGPAGIVAFVEATKTKPRDAGSLFRGDGGEFRAADPELLKSGQVVNWMAERTEPTAARSTVSIEHLYADYEVWCLGKTLAPVTPRMFEIDFDGLLGVPELAGRIQKFAKRYFGIRLIMAVGQGIVAATNLQTSDHEG